MGVGDAGNGSDPTLQFLRDLQVFLAVIADGTHVDLGGKTKVQDLSDHVRRLKVKGAFGKFGRQDPP
jgi:hypothetical protein